MAKASESVVASANSHNPAIATAAAQIVALINSRPASPREDEIAALLERTLSTVGMAPTGVAKHRAEWDRLMAACKATELTAAADDAGDAEVTAATERLDDCARRIWSESVRGPEDVLLLGEVAYWTLYTDAGGLRGHNAEKLMALPEGAPHAQTEICEEAFLALLRVYGRHSATFREPKPGTSPIAFTGSMRDVPSTFRIVRKCHAAAFRTLSAELRGDRRFQAHLHRGWQEG